LGTTGKDIADFSVGEVRQVAADLGGAVPLPVDEDVMDALLVCACIR